MRGTVTGKPPSLRLQGPAAPLAAVADAPTAPQPARIDNRPLHLRPPRDPAISARQAMGVAETCDAHYAQLMRTTAMQPVLTEVHAAMPSAQARLEAFGRWIIRHADALGHPALARRTPNAAARNLMARLPKEGHSAERAATGYITVLFNTACPLPADADRQALSLLRSALGPAPDAGAGPAAAR